MIEWGKAGNRMVLSWCQARNPPGLALASLTWGHFRFFFFIFRIFKLLQRVHSTVEYSSFYYYLMVSDLIQIIFGPWFNLVPPLLHHFSSTPFFFSSTRLPPTADNSPPRSVADTYIITRGWAGPFCCSTDPPSVTSSQIPASDWSAKSLDWSVVANLPSLPNRQNRSYEDYQCFVCRGFVVSAITSSVLSIFNFLTLISLQGACIDELNIGSVLSQGYPRLTWNVEQSQKGVSRGLSLFIRYCIFTAQVYWQ